MFLLFSYNDYYPSGGMNDLLGSFEKLPSKKEIKTLLLNEGKEYDDNIQIYNSKTGEIESLICVIRYYHEGQDLREEIQYVIDCKSKDINGDLHNDFIVVKV